MQGNSAEAHSLKNQVKIKAENAAGADTEAKDNGEEKVAPAVIHIDNFTGKHKRSTSANALQQILADAVGGKKLNTSADAGGKKRKTRADAGGKKPAPAKCGIQKNSETAVLKGLQNRLQKGATNHVAAMLVAHQKLTGFELSTWWGDGNGVTEYILQVVKHADGYTDRRKFTDGSDSKKFLTPDFVFLRCPNEADQWMKLSPAMYGVANKVGGWSLAAGAADALKQFIADPPANAPPRGHTAPGRTAMDNRPAATKAKAKGRRAAGGNRNRRGNNRSTK